MKGIGEKMEGKIAVDANVVRSALLSEMMSARGVYKAQCLGPDPDQLDNYIAIREELFDLIGMDDAMEMLRRYGPGVGALPAGFSDMPRRQRELIYALQMIPFVVKWDDTFKNVITTVGANDILDKYFAGSTYTASIFIGLKGTGTAVIADTQASHASWSEVGGTNAPAYTGNRQTPSWSAASAKSKAISSALNFAFTSGGTVAGAFLNQGGSATKDNTTGVLVSAGDFTGGSKTVASSDQINVSWSVSV